MKKDRAFWFYIIPSVTIITVIISLTPWLFEQAATPQNQVFSGINRWSGDYFTYLSYVELGRRGELGARLLATTIEQKPVFAHLAHTLIGFIFGHLLGFSSIFSYHIGRFLYGLIFTFLTFVFFYRITKNKIVSLLAFIFTFYISGFVEIVKTNSVLPYTFVRYLAWLQEQNIIGRPTGPLHYNAGFIFFILAVLWFFTVKKSWLVKTIVLGLLLNDVLLSNPFAFMILGLSFVLYSSTALFLKTKVRELLSIIGGFLLTLPLFFYNQHFLSQEPWGKLGVAPKYYVVSHPSIPFFDVIFSIGPTFFLGLLGIFFIMIKKTRLSKDVLKQSSHVMIFFICWLFVQFFLFFFGDYVKLDPLRSFNGLYYLPLSFFSAVFIYSIVKQTKHIVIVLLLLFLLTLPNYILSYKEQLFAFTDFKTFSQFIYPTKKQVEAFQWLEKNTQTASGVLAMYEASSLMIGLSGNSAEVNMIQAEKIPFYTNKLDTKQAYEFLKNNHFQYVYYGYQEKSVGGNIEQYPFLKKIFSNEEVKIYKVI